MDIDNLIDIEAAAAPEKAGRKNKGQTKLHSKLRHATNSILLKTPNSPKGVEVVNGEIIGDNDLTYFKELFENACINTLQTFKEENPELVKKHPYNWHKQLLIKLKSSTPGVSYEELDKLIIIWDCLKELLYNIGLYPTFELFSIFTGVYKYQLENRYGLNTKYLEFRKKIIDDTNNGLLNDLHSCPYNQTNKIFLAKTRGIIEQTAPKQIEVSHRIENYDNISKYRLESEK